ncbi:peptide ABC transporter substrate-binding protein [Haloimpatiens sp. FM7330]|uniref:peptide ABC transporter substrate-binding protein n=1 Tax=Haloimpatiens sp. FM7330 TaxID=3298610 RepID=UPI0036317193
MKSKKLLALVLGAALIASTAFVGCGEKKPTDDKSGDKKDNKKVEAKIDKDQYLSMVMTEPKSLDPSRSTDLYSSYVFTEILEGLTRVEVDKDGKEEIKPAGAEKWEHNDDSTVWTFHLRDYKWQDGKPVTAQQFEYGIKRTLNPKTGSIYAFLLAPIKNATAASEGKANLDTVGAKALDDKTLEITLEGPCPYFLQLTYFKVMQPQRKDMVEKYGDKYGADAEHLIACGPFKITQWTHNNKIVLEKNDTYWDKDSVKLEKLNMKVIKDESAKYNSLYKGDLDFMGVSKKEWIEKYNQTGKFDVMKGYEPSTSYLFFNEKNKMFSNANVRKAFSIAVTREDYANVITHGRHAPAYAWCPPTIQIGDKDFRETVNQDPVKKIAEENPDPKELFKKGLKELGMDPDPSKVTITLLESGTDQYHRTRAEYYQQMFQKQLGIKMKAEYVEWPVFQKRTDEMNYEIAGVTWTGDYNDPNTFFDMFMTGSGMVPTGWSNKKYDELIKKAMKSMDEEERTKLYKEAENILLYEESVIAPLVYAKKNTYKYKYVKNLMLPLFGSGVEFKYAYTEGREK